ncbi:MarR family winged helix-turn-helix transcriptional regulator [Streptomyces sp. TLI_171]|uniref:MarR family winged helix-turn-helix transcriptional regulator n=1 Tax=Streptomyces sp. TLI_171 TaxID=1938859 RepID=UPI000C671AF0|nr:MarR family winged helix-turn-helix transcriptional regulator [Streptomyces sp. TLI_171]RKE17046.1 DNA-binding MarR family transcriptional regulator [Streptomyces sp. TLI_171]
MDPMHAEPHPGALAHLQSLPSWLAGRVAARGRSLVAEAIAEHGLKLQHYAVLAAAVDEGPLAQADLVRRLAFDAKDVVLLVNHLEREGLVVREPDPRDRRKNAVTATPAGLRLQRTCARLADVANERLLAPLDPAERRTLLALLTRIVRD